MGRASTGRWQAMTGGGVGGAAGTAAEASVELHKRRAYLVLLLVSIPVLGVVVVVELPDDPFVAGFYPWLVGLLTIVMLLHAGRWVSLGFVEAATFVIAGGGVLLRLGYLLVLHPEPVSDRLLSIVGGHYWSFVVLLVLCFLLFERRVGLRIGLSLWSVSLVLTVAGLLRDASQDALTSTAMVSLGRVHAFLAAVLAIVAGAAALREQLNRALERAELLSMRALTDPLTGLANRYARNSRLEDEPADALRRGRPLSVVLFDLDHFKRINDAHGHVAGDDVLMALAEVVGTKIRPRDLPVRWGGEEFLLILPETDLEAAADIAERLRLAVGERRPGGLVVTATFGVATLTVEEPLRDLLQRADIALYEGKSAGRDRVVLAEQQAQ